MKFSQPTTFSSSGRRPRAAFTLIELLVVMAIIGLLAAVGLPALNGFGKSNAIAAAQRQMLDDIASARQRAITERTDVYMVFLCPTNSSIISSYDVNDTRSLRQVTNLLQKQYSSYALLTLRSVGDQPGRGTTNYLTAWRSLPDGIYIRTNKFHFSSDNTTLANDGVSPFQTSRFPFPAATNGLQPLAYLQFNYLGELVTYDNSGNQTFGRDNNKSVETIPLMRGSVMANSDMSADIIETPPGNSRTNGTTWNHVRIDGLTGRARVERLELKGK